MIGARVIVAVSIFSELGLDVSGRLVDRSDDGACGRVRLLTDVDGICSETHEDSCLSNKDETKLFDDSCCGAVRECEEGHEIAELAILCVADNRKRDPTEISQQMAFLQQDRILRRR